MEVVAGGMGGGDGGGGGGAEGGGVSAAFLKPGWGGVGSGQGEMGWRGKAEGGEAGLPQTPHPPLAALDLEGTPSPGRSPSRLPRMLCSSGPGGGRPLGPPVAAAKPNSTPKSHQQAVLSAAESLFCRLVRRCFSDWPHFQDKTPKMQVGGGRDHQCLQNPVWQLPGCHQGGCLFF